MSKLYKKVCKHCKKTFKTEAKRGYVCQECKKENKRRLDLERLKSQRSTYEERKKKVKINIPLFDMVKIIEAYNRTHGTKYTYGKFVLALESGLIIIDKGAEKG